MKMKQSYVQVQKQILAPLMQQSIEILLLPVQELSLTIEQELQDNPLLEISDEKVALHSPLQDTNFPPKAQTPEEETPGTHAGDAAEENHYEALIKSEESLEDRLLRDLKINLSDPEYIRIGEAIIGNLNEDGYLTITLNEIAQLSGVDDFSCIEKVLAMIQHFEPVGIASRDLKECLRLQARVKFGGPNPLALTLIEHYLPLLAKKKHSQIARELKVPEEKIRAAGQWIAQLEPRPARNYRPVSESIYIRPDVWIWQDSSGTFHTHLNREGIPKLRINGQYKQLLKNNHLSPEEEDYIKEKMRQALYFMRSLELRGQTIKTISEYILERQKGFFANGHASLVPMTLKDVAQVVNRNESTISRAIHNKYIYTPKGLFPLKYFFSQAVGPKNNPRNQQVSNRTVKEELKDIIADENKATPLSDQDIVKIFNARGTKIARRTISKYRQIMHILPTHLRKT